MLTDKPLTHSESKLLVRWLRASKGVSEDTFPLDYFYKISVSEIVERLKQERIQVKEQEILAGVRRLVVA